MCFRVTFFIGTLLDSLVICYVTSFIISSLCLMIIIFFSFMKFSPYLCCIISLTIHFSFIHVLYTLSYLFDDVIAGSPSSPTVRICYVFLQRLFHLLPTSFGLTVYFVMDKYLSALLYHSL